MEPIEDLRNILDEAERKRIRVSEE